MSARARNQLRWFVTVLGYRRKLGWRHVVGVFRGDWTLPRPAYCCICGSWAWCTNEPAPYSIATGFLCEECAEDNDKEVAAAWADYYGGLL